MAGKQKSSSYVEISRYVRPDTSCSLLFKIFSKFYFFIEEPDFNDSQQDFVELYIKPTSLLNYVEKNNASILILDYRENKNQIIKCDLTIGEINVVQLEPSTIVLG